MKKNKWVNCPICGESDMEASDVGDGYITINCINLTCASNGGDNDSALAESKKKPKTPPIPDDVKLADFLHSEQCRWNHHTDGCGWFYGNWNDIPLRSERKEYLNKARRILAKFPDVNEAMRGRPNKTRKTIEFAELQRLAFCNSPDLPQTIEMNGRRKQWVGVGWVDEGDPRGTETLVIAQKPPAGSNRGRHPRMRIKHA